MKKGLLLILSIILLFGFVLPVSASQQSNEMDMFDQEVQDAFEASEKEEQIVVRVKRSGISRGISKLKNLILSTFKNNARRIYVRATKSDTLLTITRHALERAIERGISSLAIDDILSEIPSGNLPIGKYDDILTNTRIMADPNCGTVVVLDRVSNNVITVYKENRNAIDFRVKNGRWKKALWKFG